ncbi:MAG: ATP-binding protein [Deltaproteobacteria bacterium]|nr:ATP-binding protein [Deltaproteobacteria bacterium]
MKDLYLGGSDFEALAEGDYIFIDKTEYVYKMIKRYLPFFLSRPRRFGKSLLVSIIEAIFKGRRELFKGTWIYNSDYDWQTYPVINISLNDIESDSAKDFRTSLFSMLIDIVSEEKLDDVITAKLAISKTQSPVDLFRSLIVQLSIKYNSKVVILIDEYDAPILDNIGDNTKAGLIRGELKKFYAVLKSKFKLLRFIFITGVSKFTKTSLFSELNNLQDLTLDAEYASICGITQDELLLNFSDYLSRSLDKLIKKNSLPPNSTQNDLLSFIQHWYDGYSWDGETRVYNPWSLLNFFRLNRFSDFWFESGSPSFLINLMKKGKTKFNFFNNQNIITDGTSNIDVGQYSAPVLAFQTGYLTVDTINYEKKPEEYLLRIPNNEVERSLLLYLVGLYSVEAGVKEEFTKMAKLVLTAICNKKASEAEEAYINFISYLPYSQHVPTESFYMNLLHVAMIFSDHSVDREKSVAGGIIDAKFDGFDGDIFIIEMKYIHNTVTVPVKTLSDPTKVITQKQRPKKRKMTDEEITENLNKSVQEAMNQIERKDYTAAYMGLGRTVYKVAIAVCGRNRVKFVFEEAV